MRIRGYMILALAIIGVMWAAVEYLFVDDVEPLGIEVRSETDLELVVSCAENVTATLTETADAVRIDDVGGDPADGDCLGLATLSLTRPLGARKVFVEGDEWPRGRSCVYGEFAPGGCD